MLAFLVLVSLRSLAVAAAAGAGMLVFRVKSPAVRHAAWSLVAGGMLATAAASALLPALPVRVLSARVPSPPMAVAAMAPLAVRPAPMRESLPFPWEAVYAAGVLVFASRLAWGYRLTRRLVNSSRPLGDGLYECDGVSVPLTVGWLRPKILLPAEHSAWPPDKLHAVLVHERTHIERGDWAIAVLAGANRCLFWFHPLAWWIERRLASLAEHACDDASLPHVASREAYAQVLVEMAAAVRGAGARAGWEAMAMAKTAEVRTRVERILDDSRPISSPITRGRWLAMAACAVPLVYLAAVARPARVQAQMQAPVVAPVQTPPQTPAAPAIESPPQAAQPARAQQRQSRAAQEALTEELSRIAEERLALETELQNLNSQFAYRSGKLESIEARILELQAQLASAQEVLMPAHPTIKRLQASLGVLERDREAMEQETRMDQMQTLQQRLQVKLQQLLEANREVAALKRDQGTGPSLISRRDPEYTDTARQSGIEGTVQLSVTIGADGVARDLRVIRSIDPGLDQKAIECVQSWRFNPATRAGEAVTAFAVVEVPFRLK